MYSTGFVTKAAGRRKMRLIKFRAWNPDMKEMLQVHSIQFEPHSTHPVPHILDQHNDMHTLDEIVLMQFTGLTDMEGKEIYEGDIIQWGTLTLPVTVDEFHGYRFMLGEDTLTRAVGIYGEVVGNIHEGSFPK